MKKFLIFLILVLCLPIGCKKKESIVPVPSTSDTEENGDAVEKRDSDSEDMVEVAEPIITEPIECVKKHVPRNSINIDDYDFTETVPRGFFAAGTYIIPKDDVSVKIYAGAREDGARYYGYFSSGDIAVIENVYEYSVDNDKTDFVWLQICVLSTGMEGWIKVNEREKKFKYSCKESDFKKSSYTVHSINADIQVKKKTGVIEHDNYGGYGDYKAVAVNPNGDELVIAIGDNLYIYDIGSSEEKKVIESDDDISIDKYVACAYSKDGRTIYIVDSDGNLYKYSKEEEKATKIHTFTFDDGYFYYPSEVYISPDERFVYTQSSIEWNNREDAMVFVFDQKLNKQYVFDIRSRRRPDTVCDIFSNLTFAENNDAYVSTFDFSYGNKVLVHFYVDSNDELKAEQYEPGIENTICYDPSGDGLIAIDDSKNMFIKYDKNGNEKKKKYIQFEAPDQVYPYSCCLNTNGKLVAFEYHMDKEYSYIAIYSLSTLNMLGIIKNTEDYEDGLEIMEFSGNTLIVKGNGENEYNAYNLDISEREDQFDFSVPYSSELEELCDDDYTNYEFFDSFDSNDFGFMDGGPMGVYSCMRVQFYPNGFYKVTTEKWTEDSEILGTVYGTYEMNWPYLNLFTATQRYGGEHYSYYNPEHFYGLPLVSKDLDDTTMSVQMRFDYDLKYNGNGLPKIESTFTNER